MDQQKGFCAIRNMFPARKTLVIDVFYISFDRTSSRRCIGDRCIASEITCQKTEPFLACFQRFSICILRKGTQFWDSQTLHCEFILSQFSALSSDEINRSFRKFLLNGRLGMG